MASERIDVLAVMDADIARRQQTAAALSEQARPICERLNFSRIEEMRQARAAVAELVAKADNAATALSNLIAARQVDERYEGVVTDLTAALARIGGAP